MDGRQDVSLRPGLRVLGHGFPGDLLWYAGNGPHLAIAVAGGRIAWLLQRGGRRRITSCSAYSPLVSPFNPKGGPP